MGDFSKTLSALMASGGVSAYELARQVPCDPSLISRYRNGRQKPSAKMASRLDEVLGANGQLSSLAPAGPPGRRAVLAGGLLIGGLLGVGPETQELLAWAGRHQPRIDGAVVESLAQVLAAHRHAEDALGSAAMLRPVQAQLTVINDLVKQAHGPVRPSLVDVAQQWAQFAGWLCRDTGDVAGARICYAQALEWAAELDDRSMTATILVERSYMAAEAGEVGSMIGLATAAQRDPRAAADQRALAANLEARGYAMAGDAAAAERKLGEAEALVALADARQQRHPWSYWMTPAFFQNVSGFTCGYLAGADDRWLRRAVDLLAARADETALWAPAAAFTHLAFAHAQAGDLDQACSTALTAVGAVRRTGSARHTVVLSQVQETLQARWPGDSRVAELAAALH
jgi:transcriptional regulator with XRE-family HTH domain